MRRPALALAALLLALPGCDRMSALSPEPHLPIAFTWRETGGPLQQAPAAAIRGEDDGIVVDGRLSSGWACVDLSAREEGSGNRVEVVVDVRSRDGFCLAYVATFEYRAALDGLRPGSYDVRVRHRLDGEEIPGGTHQSTVTVR